MMRGRPEFVGPEGGGVKLPQIPLPGRAKVLLAALLLASIVVSWAYFTFLEYVRPNEYGIREIQVGVSRGIQEKVLTPGLWFVMPFGFQRVHRLPSNMQVLELSMMPGRETESMTFDEAAKINTSDGFYVDVDVTILYRIVDPYKVVTKLGTGRRYLEGGVLPKADPILKQSLGQLTVEEFYVSPKRTEKAELAKSMMNAELNDKGIRIEQVLVRYFKYADAIQQNIEDKKLQDQLVFTNQSKRKAALEAQNLERIRAQGEANVNVALQEGQAYKATREAEKELYVRSKEAEADLLVKLAEAKGTELKNTALQSAGSDAQVALKMAEVLKGLDTVLLPVGGEGGSNPLDLDGVLDMFGVARKGRAAAPAPAPAEVQP